MMLTRLKTWSATALLALSCLLPAHAADPLKVGFVYTSPIGDHGWTYSHEQGRTALEGLSGGKTNVVSL